MGVVNPLNFKVFMKKFILFTLVFVMCLFTGYAQQKKYVSYTVKRGETIKSIAKANNISTRDLLKLNPGIGRKPKPQTVIIIPNKNFGKKVAETKSVANVYSVKPKETLFGISKKFGITIDELVAANKNLEEGLKIGMLLHIPKPSIAQPKDSANYVLHTVVKDDTMFNLTRRYEVTESELQLLNPNLKEGLKLGMLLKVKAKSELEATIDEALFIEQPDFNKEIKVAIMLPYQLNKLNDSLTIESFNRTNSLLNIATEFHLGVEMAIDSLRKKGLNISAHYFDTENSKYKLQYLVAKNNFDDLDVVIGPLFYDKAQWMASHIKTPVVAPVFSKKQADLNDANLIKSAPDSQEFEKKLMHYLKENYNGENVVVVNDANPENQSKLWRIVNQLKAIDSIKNIEVVKPENGFIDNELFIQKLDSMGPNWVLSLSDESVTTSAVINNLKSPVERMPIQLFALNKGKNYDNIDNAILGKLNFIFPTNEFLMADDINFLNFYNAYLRKNYATPSKFSYRGFDVTYDTLLRIASAELLEEGFEAGKSIRILALFNYEKKPFKGIENKGLRLIKYHPDLTTGILD